uniref:SIX1a n=1 Tax=Fusarium oxysporum f. sp. physali TaxID=2212625 RepID=A0A2U9DN53_FUSOX|nr:SIX1a [Fusarium oxysporum f. sp. physali]QQY97446.1 secreted in the xylem 1a [Fusarium oxysporum f. sp. physali]QQY97462.1 secreted in the xylem 1a [Fusarium oxysporum f. sp. physali]QQY97478.1 secreted in the xylem 1a [Fusarium oxysporum f. sp. physali]
MAPYSMVLLGALSILGFGAYAQEAAVREPQIFFNLTFTEYLDKVAESHGSPPDKSDLPWNDTMSSFPGNETDDGVQTETGSSLSRRGHIVNLGKREIVRGESRNDAVTNDMLQVLHNICVERFGTGWRAVGGYCDRRSRRVKCRRPDDTGLERRANKACPPREECSTFQAYNFITTGQYGRTPHNFPVCGHKIEVNDRQDQGSHTEWDGTWYPEEPKSPGTYDSFVQMAGSLNAYFNFDGVYSDGETMNSRGHAVSWSCLNCPGGKLTITNTYRPTWAVGYSHTV